MKKIQIGSTDIVTSQVAFGCMTLGGSWDTTPATPEIITKATKAVEVALEGGINFFDHADIYTKGKSEIVFAQALKSLNVAREDVVLQSKCGIRVEGSAFENSAPFYDFSYEYIMNSVDNILKRLETGYLDILLLHRPDALFEGEEVAQAFDELKAAGKVREFGVSNFNSHQMSLLQSYVDVPLVANQMELSLLKSYLIDEGMNANNFANPMGYRSLGTLEHCRHQNMTLQAYSPLAGGMLSKSPLSPELEPLKATVKQMMQKYNVEEETILIAWLMRHPMNIQPVIGTLNEARIKACMKASDITLTKEEWYRLYNSLPSRRLL